MKKLLLLSIVGLCGQSIQAQPWMPSVTKGPVKYSDAVNSYRHSPFFIDKDAVNEDEGQEGAVKEVIDNQFRKWDYYWTHHLDQDGYMVPPAKTLEAWQDYVASNGNQTERTTTIPSNWVFEGPDVCNHGYAGLGRINVVAFDPMDSNKFYIGSAAGSAWKTTDGGLTWNPMYSNLPTLGVADIKVNPVNPNTIYVATGDGDAGDAYSSGVIVSHDGGTTWGTTGLNWSPTTNITAHSLLINPSDTNTMILASSGGIYKTHNSGASWTNVFSGNFKQIVYKPQDTSIIYGSMYTDSSAEIMRSVDGGNTWSQVTSFNDAQRIALAVSPATANIVMAVASGNSSGLKGIYTSINSGASFTATYTNDTSCKHNLLGYDIGLPTHYCNGQGWYDLCIAMNPANASQVIVGGVNTYYSSNGGTTWQIANQWWTHLSGVSTVHADKHCLAYNPLGGTLYETCDGGIYKNNGPLTENWTDLTDGITITEFYRNAVNNDVNFVIGGAQDNGTKSIGDGFTADLTGGDGMQPLINYGDPWNIWYCSFPSGSINMTRDGGTSYHNITDTIHSSGNWVTPYVLHPTDTATLVIGYKQVFATYNNGLSWSPISPVFDNNADISNLAIATSNPNYLYLTYFDYNVWNAFIKYTPDFGATWDTIPSPTGSYISDLIIDPKNEKHIWITVSAYGVPKVWEYSLATNVWLNVSGSLPNIPVQCMVIDTTFKTLYLGTDAAIYFKDSSASNWTLFDNNLPRVQVDDLNINYTTNEIWAATFGRGMWKSVKAEKQPLLGVASVAKAPGTVSISPNPNQGAFTISASGSLLTQGQVNVRILSSDGKTAWETTGVFDNSGKMKINTSGLAAGFYICEVSNNTGLVRGKLVIY